MTGLNKYEEKNRRNMRRRNHIARDLALPKYPSSSRERDSNQRVLKPKVEDDRERRFRRYNEIEDE